MAAYKLANERCCPAADEVGKRRRMSDGVTYIRSQPVVCKLLCSGPPLSNDALTPLFDLVPRIVRSRDVSSHDSASFCLMGVIPSKFRNAD